MLIDIKEGMLYYTDMGYVVLADTVYMGQDHRERVSFNYLMDPDRRYDCYLYRAQESWISMETWIRSNVKWELK